LEKKSKKINQTEYILIVAVLKVVKGYKEIHLKTYITPMILRRLQELFVEKVQVQKLQNELEQLHHDLESVGVTRDQLLHRNDTDDRYVHPSQYIT